MKQFIYDEDITYNKFNENKQDAINNAISDNM